MSGRAMKRKTPNITHDTARELFDYAPEGYLVYRTNRGSNRCAGKRAGITTTQGYTMVRIKDLGITIHAQRLIWFWHYGEWPPADVDHIDGDRLNNRIENLRLASRTENNHNSRKRKGTTSPWKGVSFCKNTKRWFAYLNFDLGRISLGRFDSMEEAGQMYNFAAYRLCGEFAKYNEAEQTCPLVLGVST